MMPLREKQSTKVSQEMPKVNINLFKSKKNLLRSHLPGLEKEKTDRANQKLKILRDSR